MPPKRKTKVQKGEGFASAFKKAKSVVKKSVATVQKAAKDAGVVVPKNVISRHLTQNLGDVRSPGNLVGLSVGQHLKKVGLGKQAGGSKRIDATINDINRRLHMGSGKLSAAQKKKILDSIPRTDAEIQIGGKLSSDLAGLSSVGFQTGNPKSGAYMLGAAIALKTLGFGKQSGNGHSNSSGAYGLR